MSITIFQKNRKQLIDNIDNNDIPIIMMNFSLKFCVKLFSLNILSELVEFLILNQTITNGILSEY